MRGIGGAIRSLRLWTNLYFGYLAVMLVLERKMRRTGGPGIIPFEFAGNRAAAEAIMTTWGLPGQRAARASLLLDFGYMATYGVLTALLLDRVAQRNGHSRLVSMLVVLAVAGDAAEGLALLRVLDRRDVDRNARRAKMAASAKFAVLSGCAGYLVRFVARSWRAPVAAGLWQ